MNKEDNEWMNAPLGDYPKGQSICPTCGNTPIKRDLLDLLYGKEGKNEQSHTC